MTLSNQLEQMILDAGGSLVVPVLQPDLDKIPFGLALTLQPGSTAPQQTKSLQGKLDDLFELQYVLEGNGQASNVQLAS